MRQILMDDRRKGIILDRMLVAKIHIHKSKRLYMIDI